MMTLHPRPGFDPSKINWGSPGQRVSTECSYCDAAIPDRAVPLRMFTRDGWAAVFCDQCAATWFGFSLGAHF